MREVKVKKISDDGWSRPRLKNIETGAVYADTNLGDYPPSWHTTTRDGEPIAPIREGIKFVIVD